MFQSNLRIKSAVLIFSLLLSLLIYFVSSRLVAVYGIISIVYLILVMIAGPLYRIFTEFPFKNIYRASLGGLGISTFYFAFLHSWIGFFNDFHGFAGLPFLGNIYLLATILGFIALLILAAMAGTSFTWAMKALGKRWKTIHKFIYLAGIAIIVHTILIGSDFRDFTSPTAFFLILGFLLLIILLTVSTYRYLLIKYPNMPSRLFSASLSAILIGSLYLLFMLHEFIIGGHVH